MEESISRMAGSSTASARSRRPRRRRPRGRPPGSRALHVLCIRAATSFPSPRRPPAPPSPRTRRHGRVSGSARSSVLIQRPQRAGGARRGRPGADATARDQIDARTTGSRGVLRADEVGGRRDRVGDRESGRVQPAPAAVAASAPVIERRRPATPIATSSWPWRQARPKLSVISTAIAAPLHSRSRARSCRAAPSGSSGSSTIVSSTEELDSSIPALAQTKPWCVRRSGRRARRARSRLTRRARPGRHVDPAWAEGQCHGGRRGGCGERHDRTLGLG